MFNDNKKIKESSYIVEPSGFGKSVVEGIPVGKTSGISLNGLQDSLIGTGSTSDSWKICISGRWYFLKRPKKQYADNPKYLECFEREFQIGYQLNNKHIVRYITKGHDDDGVYILTDYIEGVTLTKYLEDNPDLSRSERRRIIMQIAEGLKYMHEHQVVHFDLKPENVMITSLDHSVKIIDLGFSYSSCYKAIGCGSKLFSSPEQFLDPKSADLRSDIYALGAVIRFIESSGHFNAGTKYTGRYKNVVRKAMQHDKERRYGSVDEMVAALNGTVKKSILSVAAMILIFVVLCAAFPRIAALTISNTHALSGIKKGADKVTFRIKGVPFSFIKVKAGTFLMGSPLSEKHRYPIETQHYVKLTKDFYISETEITQRQWSTIMGNNPAYYKGKSLPVEYVSYNDVCGSGGFLERINAAFVGNGTFMLPTESQWEFAARGGVKSRGYIYSGSNNVDAVAWHADNSGDMTHHVAGKRPNELGIYDMSGNVSELCSDKFAHDYPAGTKENPVVDPTGPDKSLAVIGRGGEFNKVDSLSKFDCRVADRGYIETSYKAKVLGFRIIYVIK